MIIDCRDLVGKPFKIHGRGEDGYDCYGICIEMLKRNGIVLHDFIYDTLKSSEGVDNSFHENVKYERLSKPEPLCIIEIEVKGLPIHAGVYIGDGKFIHATENYGVIIEPLNRYSKRVKGLYKVKNSSI